MEDLVKREPNVSDHQAHRRAAAQAARCASTRPGWPPIGLDAGAGGPDALRGQPGSRTPAAFPPPDGQVLVHTGGFLQRCRRCGPGGGGGPRTAGRSTCGTWPRSWTARRSPTSMSFSGRALRLGRKGHQGGARRAASSPAVTLTVAKRKGTNAITVADQVLARVEERAGTDHPGERPDHRHPQLRGDRQGEIQRTAAPHVHRRRLRDAPHLAHPGPAGVGRRGPCHPRDPGPDPDRLLSLRLHPQPDHPLCPDLLHRHPGGRRHRGGGEHGAPFPPAGEPGPAHVRGRHRGGGRGGQSHDPGHPHGHCRHPAHGLCGRADGALHAAHSGRGLGRHGLLPARRLYRDPLGLASACSKRGAGGTGHDARRKTGPPGSTAGSWTP